MEAIVPVPHQTPVPKIPPPRKPTERTGIIHTFEKMKRLFFTLLLLVPYLFAHAQEFSSDLERQGLKGDIKKLIEKEFNGTEDSLMWKAVSNYNDTGNQLDYITYSPTDVILSKSIFKYNDTTGKLADIKRFKADGSLNVKTIYKYDAKGRVIEENNFDPQGTLFMTAKSRFDMKGNRTVKDCMNEYGILFLKTNYKYDKHNRDIEEREYDSHHSLKFTTTHEYHDIDRNGNWRKRITYKNDVPNSVTIREIEYEE